MSIYLVALERKLNQKSTFTVNILRNVEKKACTLADLMVIESEEYIDWFVQTHNAERDKFWLVPLGAEEGRIIPFDIPNEVNFRSDKLFTVIYWGTFIQNHGVEVMVDAACSLKDIPEINFLFIGTGPERSLMMEKALGIGLKNVSFPGWVDENELMIKINKADLCLGIFGNTPQSHMTIQNKIYECLAMRKPLVTGKSKVISKNFIHGMHMFCCERDPDSLAESILFLKDQPEVLNKIANEGYRYYLENYSNKKIGLHFLNGLLKLCSKKLLND